MTKSMKQVRVCEVGFFSDLCRFVGIASRLLQSTARVWLLVLFYRYRMLKEDSVQSEYDSEMEEYDSDSEDLVVIMGGDDGQESGTNTTAKVNAGEDGLITIRNEDNVSAYNIDINKLKTQKWKMEGDESDYFNYGFNESMWKV